jgi:hypothetical protein
MANSRRMSGFRQQSSCYAWRGNGCRRESSRPSSSRAERWRRYTSGQRQHLPEVACLVFSSSQVGDTCITAGHLSGPGCCHPGPRSAFCLGFCIIGRPADGFTLRSVGAPCGRTAEIARVGLSTRDVVGYLSSNSFAEKRWVWPLLT